MTVCSKLIAAFRDRDQGSGNHILPGEPLAIGYFVAPSTEKKMYKMKLKVKVKLINKIMQKFSE